MVMTPFSFAWKADRRNRHQTIRRQTKNIGLLSSVQTYSILLSTSRRLVPLSLQKGMTRNLLTKIKCFLSLGEIIVHPNLGALNKPSLTMVKKNYSSSTFAFIGILPLPGHSRFVKIYLTLQSLPAFYFSLQLLS